ncbi:subtilisin-like serine-protease S [Cornus florida]|uniref:subtilisin-like serine-protease S n=1 Tax=Cornus florida TaxID=4283 RepID=UPI0028978C49|nr:subtilisin-like serine-protease S [Cornus florida]
MTCNNIFLQHYIVYMGTHSFRNSETLISCNHEMLASFVGSIDGAQQAIIHHYHKSFRGFSAMLTSEQAEQIAKNNSVISVFESKVHQLHTSRSWDFMGATADSLYSHISVDRNYEYDVIVGHLDSGVWPESPSFSQNGLGPVPKRFKGECVTGEEFSSTNCNRKIIGARYYHQGFETENGPLENYANGRTLFRSPRDDYGHGSHTASTAVGSLVQDVTLPISGMAAQTFRGGAPLARLAVYKVCWFNTCSCADVLKAYDDAIFDGVDIITMSLGSDEQNYLKNCFTIGAFHAFRNGILVSASAGNSGGVSTVSNHAPWMLTVAASSTDRDFVSAINLGNSRSLKGYGQNDIQLNDYYEVIAASSAPNYGVSVQTASACKRNALNEAFIRGKIVVCTLENWNDDRVEKSNVVSEAGGVGMILIDPSNDRSSNVYVVPTSVIVDQDDLQELQAYLGTTKPFATISQSIALLYSNPAPEMATFSSKGPSNITPDLIKPDITAPGVNILAAWPPPSGANIDAPTYIIYSGTSMACPHVSGVAAILKALHPHWSPAEIQSALMTTASQFDNTGQRIRSGSNFATPFDLGSGHLDPNAALNPGLVYDFNVDDVILFLCNHGSDATQLQNLVGKRIICPNSPVNVSNFNYPSIGIDNLSGETSVLRTVTYRGKKGDPKIFNVSVQHPEGISLEVQPKTLDFSRGQTKAIFKVNVWVNKPLKKFVFGTLTWFNDVHRVSSPIAIRAS